MATDYFVSRKKVIEVIDRNSKLLWSTYPSNDKMVGKHATLTVLHLHALHVSFVMPATAFGHNFEHILHNNKLRSCSSKTFNYGIKKTS